MEAAEPEVKENGGKESNESKTNYDQTESSTRRGKSHRESISSHALKACAVTLKQWRWPSSSS